ncbi:hypothetical protein MRX96_021222 [Rhipicephalus microplus]
MGEPYPLPLPALSLGETEKLAMTRGSRKSVSTLAVNQSHQSSRYPDSMRDSTVKNAVNAANKKEKGKGAETVPAKAVDNYFERMESGHQDRSIENWR